MSCGPSHFPRTSQRIPRVSSASSQEVRQTYDLSVHSEMWNSLKEKAIRESLT